MLQLHPTSFASQNSECPPPPLRLLRCGLPLADDTGKHASKFYRRLHGCTALEVAVTLGHLGVAQALLAAGARVRRHAWTTVALYCPAGRRDGASRLLLLQASSQVCAAAACSSSILVSRCTAVSTTAGLLPTTSPCPPMSS